MATVSGKSGSPNGCYKHHFRKPYKNGRDEKRNIYMFSEKQVEEGNVKTAWCVNDSEAGKKNALKLIAEFITGGNEILAITKAVSPGPQIRSPFPQR